MYKKKQFKKLQNRYNKYQDSGSVGLLMNICHKGLEDDLKHLSKLIELYKPEIGTLASEIENKSNLNNENIVKVITDIKINDKNFPIALDFKRKESNFNSNIYHHLGIYAYKPEILKQLVNFGQTKNEIKSKLEQLRALDNKIKINVGLAKFCPIGVDTMEDYLALKKKLEYNS